MAELPERTTSTQNETSEVWKKQNIVKPEAFWTDKTKCNFWATTKEDIFFKKRVTPLQRTPCQL